ncbi:MAG: substrate-binding domain-containing protein, partial [Cyanobacteria bacterium P01_G01_bin.38]
MLRNQNARFRKLKTYVPLAMVPALLLSATVQVDRLMAQSAATEFTMPDSVPDGTAIKIDGDNSMAAINAVLTEQFAQKFNGAEITADTSGTEPALQAVLDGDIDLAAISRPLTDEEKAQGLIEIPIARHKIAIFVGPESSYADDLTIAQFGQIFRGEVSDWSELGGTAGPIRFVDRPDTSDTRSAFRNYPVFKSAPFETGATAEPASEDTTDAVVAALGTDGIGYAIADQVTARSDVRILSMHSVMPTDQRYPFSQPLAYVYKGPEANPAVQAFLGYATAPENEGVVEAARKVAATGAPVVAAQSTTPLDTESAEPDAATEAPATQPNAVPPAEDAPAEGVAPEGAPTEAPAEGAPADEGADQAGDREAAGWWPWLLIPAAGGL